MNVIEVENLGKKYIISHQQERYTAFRDVVANMAKKTIKKVIGKDEILPKKEEFWALKNIDFEVSQGDRIGIIGRNGAGKSTLLKLLSKITEPTEGKIKIKGKIASLLEVGTGFHAELTGRENIFLNGAILGLSKNDIKKKFDEIVEFAEVEKFLDTPVKKYSSGMYVRLAFAIAANLEPDILIIDEVLAVGDASFQEKCLGRMKNISKAERKTILFVSHNMGAISALCGRVICLENGKIVFDGNSNDGISFYQNNNLKNISGEYDFNKIDPSRYGNGKAKFKFINVFASNNNDYGIYSGGNLTIKVGIESTQRITGARVDITLYDLNNYRLVDVSTSMKNILVEICPGSLKVYEFNLKNVLLKPGDYFIGLWLGKINEDIDAINYASKITFGINPYSNDSRYMHPGVYECNFDLKEL